MKDDDLICEVCGHTCYVDDDGIVHCPNCELEKLRWWVQLFFPPASDGRDYVKDDD